MCLFVDDHYQEARVISGLMIMTEWIILPLMHVCGGTIIT